MLIQGPVLLLLVRPVDDRALAARYVAPQNVYNDTYVGLACRGPLSLLRVALVIATKVDK